MKLLVIDIETRPNLAYVWDIWNQNIRPEQLLEEKEVISFAAKWVGEDEIMFYSIHHNTKRQMVKAAWKLLDAADGVISYNGKKFDMPHLNLEFLRLHMPPPSSYRNIDLLLEVRRSFNFTSNKLSHVADKLGIGAKVEHEGFALWLKCIDGDHDAWERMKKYNMQDVLLTEELYVEVQGWIQNHPSYAAISGEQCCPNCGHEGRRSKGFSYTKTGMYRRYACKRCGKNYRDTHRIQTAPVTETAAW